MQTLSFYDHVPEGAVVCTVHLWRSNHSLQRTRVFQVLNAMTLPVVTKKTWGTLSDDWKEFQSHDITLAQSFLSAHVVYHQHYNDSFLMTVNDSENSVIN